MSNLDHLFLRAVDYVTNNKSAIELYGLYNQAVTGDNPTAYPKEADCFTKKKYNRWLEMKGVSQASAKQQYIDYVICELGGSKADATGILPLSQPQNGMGIALPDSLKEYISSAALSEDPDSGSSVLKKEKYITEIILVFKQEWQINKKIIAAECFGTPVSGAPYYLRSIPESFVQMIGEPPQPYSIRVRGYDLSGTPTASILYWDCVFSCELTFA